MISKKQYDYLYNSISHIKINEKNYFFPSFKKTNYISKSKALGNAISFAFVLDCPRPPYVDFFRHDRGNLKTLDLDLIYNNKWILSVLKKGSKIYYDIRKKKFCSEAICLDFFDNLDLVFNDIFFNEVIDSYG